MSDSQSNSSADMSVNSQIEEHRQIILAGEAKGGASKFLAYARLSGPGWLQSAITLGGGSLANALYLGVLGGFAFMWLQPMAMLFGIVMMSAIAYITLSTGQRPLRQINNNISPILGWGWLAASMMANMVWSLPQFALAVASLRQNLLPGILGPEAMPEMAGKMIAAVIILALVITNVMIYISGGKGTKVFEMIMKIMVGAIVICFFGVVIQLSVAGQINWGAIGAGLIPSFESLFSPAPTFDPFLTKLTETGRTFWSDMIVGQQRDVMIGAAATAVGINMTFLLPYSMLRKGWNRDFRGMAIFDLSTGLFIPFMLATGCVVISAASQFHAQPAPGLVDMHNPAIENKVEPAANLTGPYQKLLTQRLKADIGALEFSKLSAEEIKEQANNLPLQEREMAAVLVKRDAFNLAQTLEPLVGKTVAQYVFGFGVLGMALNAATMLMLINGLCYCELRNRAPKGKTQRIGSLMVCVGILGPFLWTGDAKMWLAVPTSVFAMVLLPIAYVVFALMMNNKTILGKDMPTGKKRLVWNVLMIGACTFAAIGSLWSLWSKLGWIGMVLFGLFILVVVTTRKKRQPVNPEPASGV